MPSSPLDPSRPALDVAAALEVVTSSLPDGGEARSGQLAMAEAVDEAIAERRHLIVQAGTGTGKSLAYLVPAALARRPVVVATATKALQEQLATRDLPLVAEALGGVSVAVLKGRSNYACRQRAVELAERGFQTGLADDEPADAGGADEQRLVTQVERLLGWEKTTLSGDRADLAEPVSDRAWSMLSIGPRECPGAFQCPQGGRCFTEQARQAAAAADVVVINLHLLGADLASSGQVLPEHDVVIIDEAHELENVMTQSLGVELSPGRIRSLVATARTALGRSAEPAVSDLATTAENLAAALGELDDASAVDLSHATAVAAALGRADDEIRAVLSALRGAGSEGDAVATRAQSTATRLLDELGRLRSPATGEVLWVSGTRSSRILTLSPIAVGPVLRTRLFEHATVIMTSATIPPRLAERVGLASDEVTEIDVGSPFDFRSQSLLYVATDIGDRRAPDAEDKIATELAEMLDAAGGRTLALFTSRRALDVVSRQVASLVDHPILVQGTSSNNALVERFRTEEDACLFATMGLWQGLDVPGRSLSLVAIDRLPFGRPDDPLLDARRQAAGSRAFQLVDLPRAATLLAQGAGRLIRSLSDEGVVAIFDTRLATASYRSALLEALPPMKRSVDRDEVMRFLRAIASDAHEEAAQK